MRMKEEPIKVKIVGPRHRLSKIIKSLELHYFIVKTSRIIDHKEDAESHIYLSILEERYQ